MDKLVTTLSTALAYVVLGVGTLACVWFLAWATIRLLQGTLVRLKLMRMFVLFLRAYRAYREKNEPIWYDDQEAAPPRGGDRAPQRNPATPIGNSAPTDAELERARAGARLHEQNPDRTSG